MSKTIRVMGIMSEYSLDLSKIEYEIIGTESYYHDKANKFIKKSLGIEDKK